MIKLVRVPLLYGTLICGMTGVASAQSVPFPPMGGSYGTGIPGTYDHASASGRPEYNLKTEQHSRTKKAPKKAPVSANKARHGTGAQMQHPTGG
jgi:hypothetical protein